VTKHFKFERKSKVEHCPYDGRTGAEIFKHSSKIEKGREKRAENIETLLRNTKRSMTGTQASRE